MEVSRRNRGVLLLDTTSISQLRIVGRAPLTRYVPSVWTTVAPSRKGRFAMAVQVECVQCGHPFSTKPSRLKNGKGKFCSTDCYYRWQRGRTKGKVTRYTKHCEICGTEFIATPSNVNRGWDRFCSRRCANIAQSKLTTADSPSYINLCETCGRPIDGKPSAASARRFCSIECAREWRIDAVQGEENPFWKGGPSEHICDCCGKTFVRYESSTNGRHKFCSKDCYHSWMGGEHAYQWTGGQTEPYRYEFFQIRPQIIERDSGTCQLCGEPAKTVHHIDYDKHNNDPSNLILLCRSCHGKTNVRRKQWKRHFETLMEKRNALCNVD